MVRRTRSVVSGFGVLAAAIALCQLAGSAAATAQGQGATRRVIIVLKNQEKSLPPTRALIGARRRAIASSQAPITSQLSSSGARSVHSYDVINAVSATVSASEESSLQSNSAVSEVVPDQVIHLAPSTQQAAAPGAGTATTPGGTRFRARAPPGQVQLNPQALETINADSDNPHAKTARSLGLTGAGVKVGFIADGLDPNNPDFIRPERRSTCSSTTRTSPARARTAHRRRGGVRRRQLDRRAGAARSTTSQGYSALGPNRPVQDPRRGRGPGRRAWSPSTSPATRTASFNSHDPGGDRLCGLDRPRQRPQRIVRQQLLSR